MQRILPLLIAVLALFATGIVDLDIVIGHEDDCADRCCDATAPGGAGHCSCCCVMTHVATGLDRGDVRCAPPSALAEGSSSAAIASATLASVFHPPRA